MTLQQLIYLTTVAECKNITEAAEKLFISQPMRDKTDKEIKAERAKIVEAVTERFGEVEVIDSFFESAPHDAKPLWFLGKSLELLSSREEMN